MVLLRPESHPEATGCHPEPEGRRILLKEEIDMKYLKLLIITLVTVSLAGVGCSPKKGDESPTSPTQNQSKSSDEAKKDSVPPGEQTEASEGEEGALDPVEVSNAIENIKALPHEEQLRRLRLEVASIVGGVIFFKASYPLERAAHRAALYYAVIKPLQTSFTAFDKKVEVVAQVKKEAPARIREAYLKDVAKIVGNIKKAHPGLTTPQALNKIDNREAVKRGAMKKEKMVIGEELNEKIAAIEKDMTRELVKTRRGYLASRGLVFGAKGLRYLGVAAIGVGSAWLIYDLFSQVMTSEMSDVEMTAEDRLSDFERAAYNYRHDPENIDRQNRLIAACAASLPDIIGFLNIQMDLTHQIIEGIKNSSMTEEEKTAAVSAKETELKELNEKLELHKAMLGIVSSGEKKEEALKIITESMDKLVGLDKEADKQGSFRTKERDF